MPAGSRPAAPPADRTLLAAVSHHFHTPHSETLVQSRAAACGPRAPLPPQWAISTGTVIAASRLRVTPPKARSRNGEWP